MIKSNKETIKLWLIPFNLPKLQNTSEEIKFVKNCSELYSKRYLYSRSYMRSVLGNYFCIDALSVPLYSPPYKPPILRKDFGYISLSHCDDRILLGWSTKEIGVDIENKKRKVLIDLIINRFFKKYKDIYFSNNKRQIKKDQFLKLWVTTEAVIKYKYGNLFLDINNWFCDFESKKAINNLDKQEVNIELIDYKSWFIGLASNNLEYFLERITSI